MPERGPSEFVTRLEHRWSQGHFVCVGLDTDYAQMPEMAKGNGILSGDIYRFNAEIIDATADLVCAYKPNIAFYEAQGSEGFRALRETIRHIKDNYPDISVILDAKRADVRSTNMAYVQAAFNRDQLNADAITVPPYLGKEAMKPFLDRTDKGVIVLARTSNPGAGEFQDLEVESNGRREKLYLRVARNVAESWNENGNCGVVVGATYPKELAEIRGIVGDLPILIPGIGTPQGGRVNATLIQAGSDSRGMGMIINSSQDIIFASKGADYAIAAQKATTQLRTDINKYL